MYFMSFKWYADLYQSLIVLDSLVLLFEGDFARSEPSMPKDSMLLIASDGTFLINISIENLKIMILLAMDIKEHHSHACLLITA